MKTHPPHSPALSFLASGIPFLAAWAAAWAPLQAMAQETGAEIYMARCFWCHGEEGRGDGLSAAGMFPRPRDFVRADYKIRSTAHGQIPTDEDLFRIISRGMPGTPMPAWEKILSEEERLLLVEYIKSLSARFESEPAESLSIPQGEGSAERGQEVFQSAKCFLCHGEQGRGDGEIAAKLNFEWGQPYWARDFTRGWTFKGGHAPEEIYLRISGGLNGTPMGPYRDLLSDRERWDLAHYVVSLDEEPSETSEDFLVTAALIEGEIPETFDDPAWQIASPAYVPLAGQVVLDPPLRWWIPTAGSAHVRGLWNGREVAFLLEWNDPTGPGGNFLDSAQLQFAAAPDSKPYFLYGDANNAVKVWRWQAESEAEEWTASGSDDVTIESAGFTASSSWEKGRWHVIFRRGLEGGPRLEPGGFAPVRVSVRDGANGEAGAVRAISTWIYATLEKPPSARPWLLAAVWFLAAAIAELWILKRLGS